MNLTSHFNSVFTKDIKDYPENPPVSKTLWKYMPRYLYCTLEGVEKQFNRIVGQYGTIAYWEQKENDEFEFSSFCVDKQKMYFVKCSYEEFYKSFVDHRPEVKQELNSMFRMDLVSELESLLKEEYEDNYDFYLSELLSTTPTVTTASVT